MDDSKTVIGELMAAALTWTDETAQKEPQRDQQLVLKLHNVLQKERTTAVTEISRLKALLARTDDDGPADGDLAEENARLRAELAQARQEQEAIRQLISGAVSGKHNRTLTSSYQLYASLTTRQLGTDSVEPLTISKVHVRTSTSSAAGDEATTRSPSVAEREAGLSDKGLVVPTGPRSQVLHSSVAQDNTTLAEEAHLVSDSYRGTKRGPSAAGLRSDHCPSKRGRAFLAGRKPVCGHCMKNRMQDTCDGKATCTDCHSLEKHCVYQVCHTAGCERPECSFLHTDSKKEPQRKVAGINFNYNRR
ncbi:hypothetical protein LTR15_000520 [Elasticomyces elasticus]|nr:hypothetical protein LTR15_000520 [Elasticomyces elasticus]